MKIQYRSKLSFFELFLGYFLVFVAVLMAMVMNTARDRQDYLTLFSQPFQNTRIEIGFQYYMKAFELAGIPPDVAIVITCVLIYLLMAWVWFAWVRIQWLESILLFNFFVFSLFNYYLGTSIRMGLATALALYACQRIMHYDHKFWIVLWVSPLLHYGAAPFVLLVTWVVATRNVSWRWHKILIVLACIVLPLAVGLILQQIGVGKYYLAYFNNEKGQTDRIFPFTYAFFCIALFLSSMKGEDSILRRIVFYGVPFLLYGVLSGVVIFSKMLIPNIFLSAVLITSDYRKLYVQNIDNHLRLFIAFALSGLALIYALRAYEYF